MANKDQHYHDHDHDCNCQNGDCECEHSGIITLCADDGSTRDVHFLGVVEYEEDVFVAVAEPDSDIYEIFQLKQVGDESEFVEIEDDALFNTVAEMFEQSFEEDALEDGEEEE